MQQALNRYLYTIRLLKKRQSYVCSADIARYLGVKPPSVCVAVRRLREQGYLIREEDGDLTLSPSGTEYANRLHERVCFFSQLLLKLGVESETAEEDAIAFSWTMSDFSYDAFRRFFWFTGAAE